MQSAVRKLGNSAAMILPQPVLAALGATFGDKLDIAIENDRMVVSASTHPRAGWAEAAARIAKEEDPELEEWLAMPHDDNFEWEW